MSEVRLSPVQQEVVAFDEGAILVVAGPGSGKTRVLTERVRRLLAHKKGHFRVLALTFTNKAANEMRERLKDLRDLTERASIGTIHGFCLELLRDRGKVLGVTSDAQIFESYADRKQILLDAVTADPVLLEELHAAGDERSRGRRIDDWLKAIAFAKSRPLSRLRDDERFERLYQTYNAGLRACGAYDFDDLLLLARQLLLESPGVADFYRRLYRYICVDEAQDLNEAQYEVLRALCGDSFKNVMMVGDPKQSIYGFNTSSPEYMDRFAREFSAKKVELTDNFRSSKAVVAAARALVPAYSVAGQLPVRGEIQFIAGENEEDEAQKVVSALEDLLRNGHPDVEGRVTPERCAILGRTRFALLQVESELLSRQIPFVKRVSVSHENASGLVASYFLALRVVCNPRDTLHLGALARTWGLSPSGIGGASLDAIAHLKGLAEASRLEDARAVVGALEALTKSRGRLAMKASMESLREYADGLDADNRRDVYEDTAVLLQEWEQYVRLGGRVDSLSGFISSMSLGVTHHGAKEGVALITVHSSKGLEFDAVFMMGMADGTFPDYRSAVDAKARAEEVRNAFVAVTRSKRLLTLSYSKRKVMPWGDVRLQDPSPYLKQIMRVSAGL